MNFDIKDVKSWSTRNEVELGKIGFFADSTEQLYKEECVISKLSLITKIDAFSFGDENNNSYAFFLPLDAVKEDKPKEKKYRSFEDAYELYKFLLPSTSLTRKDFSNKLLLNFPITYRKRDTQNFTTTELITSVEVAVIDSCHLTTINGKELEYWFANYEITNADGKWQPFGVEVNE